MRAIASTVPFDLHHSAAWKVATIALASRIAFLALGAVSDFLHTDYDTSSSLGAGTCDADQHPHPRCSPLQRASQSTVVWDAVYFDRISNHGYEYEHYTAFFPGWPGLVKLLTGKGAEAAAWSPVAALAASAAAFTCAATLLFGIVQHATRDEHLAARAALVLCLSPASVFLTYAYTEAAFLLATFLGVWLVQQKLTLLAALPLAASCSIRSNGLVNAGFLAFKVWQELSHAVCEQPWRARAASLWRSLRALAGVALIAATLRSVFTRGTRVFCDGAPAGSVPRPYCQPEGPSMYAFVQSEYWGVGFLRYYTAKQAPNFVLAAPTIALSAAAVAAYARRNPVACLTLGHTLPAAWLPAKLLRRSRACDGFGAPAVFVFVVQLAAMLSFGATFMHIQVLTRFLTSCPALYIFVAELLSRPAGAASRGALAFCVCWAWLGLVLFPNFYPWT